MQVKTLVLTVKRNDNKTKPRKSLHEAVKPCRAFKTRVLTFMRYRPRRYHPYASRHYLVLLRALEFLRRALEFLHHALEFLHHALEFLHRALEFLHHALEFLRRALEFVRRALEFVRRALELELQSGNAKNRSNEKCMTCIIVLLKSEGFCFANVTKKPCARTFTNPCARLCF